jgi:hypothetical protein
VAVATSGDVDVAAPGGARSVKNGGHPARRFLPTIKREDRQGSVNVFHPDITWLPDESIDLTR